MLSCTVLLRSSLEWWKGLGIQQLKTSSRSLLAEGEPCKPWLWVVGELQRTLSAGLSQQWGRRQGLPEVHCMSVPAVFFLFPYEFRASLSLPTSPRERDLGKASVSRWTE